MNDEDITTKSMLENILERLIALTQELHDFRSEVRVRLDGFEKRLVNVEYRLNRIESRLDRVESMTLEMRADLRDIYDQIKDRIPETR